MLFKILEVVCVDKKKKKKEKLFVGYTRVYKSNPIAVFLPHAFSGRPCACLFDSVSISVKSFIYMKKKIVKKKGTFESLKFEKFSIPSCTRQEIKFSPN